MAKTIRELATLFRLGGFASLGAAGTGHVFSQGFWAVLVQCGAPWGMGAAREYQRLGESGSRSGQSSSTAYCLLHTCYRSGGAVHQACEHQASRIWDFPEPRACVRINLERPIWEERAYWALINPDYIPL